MKVLVCQTIWYSQKRGQRKLTMPDEGVWWIQVEEDSLNTRPKTRSNKMEETLTDPGQGLNRHYTEAGEYGRGLSVAG